MVQVRDELVKCFILDIESLCYSAMIILHKFFQICDAEGFFFKNTFEINVLSLGYLEFVASRYHGLRSLILK